MIDGLKEKFGLSWLELANISFFLSVFYAGLYKLGFYSNLGISWVLGILPLNYIFFTSVKYLMSTTFGILLGISIEIKSKNTRFHLPIIILWAVIICILLFIKTFYFEQIKQVFGGSSILFFIFLNCMQIAQLAFTIKLFRDNKAKTAIWIWCLISLFSPLATGFFEADALRKSPTYFTNMVKLERDHTKWYLIEMLNDKAVIKKDGTDKIYKIVDVKEIEFFKDTNK
ncbi:hypothetical protein [Acinetobacter sp. MD2]|uniref:hypothetical protein n=1 Tax=Acinetobacter sp. MD2 TaxID=2600066 RepID=UPI002D7725CF|nr:hypothetical protein [Acinetobacter sp. MD2]